MSVTFDDSFRSVIELARPVLRELGVPGTVFVPTSFAGSERPMQWSGITSWLDGPNESELIPMSWDELGELPPRAGRSARTPHASAASAPRRRRAARGARRIARRARGAPRRPLPVDRLSVRRLLGDRRQGGTRGRYTSAAVRWPAGSRRRARSSGRACRSSSATTSGATASRSLDRCAGCARPHCGERACACGAGCERRRPADHRRHRSLRLDASASAPRAPRGAGLAVHVQRGAPGPDPGSPSPPGSTGCRWAIASGT